MLNRLLRPLTLAAAALCISGAAAQPATETSVEPVVSRYVAGNVPAAEVVDDLFAHFGLKYRTEGSLPDRKVSLRLVNLPLSEALRLVAAETGCTVRIRQEGGVQVLRWSLLPPATRVAPGAAPRSTPETRPEPGPRSTPTRVDHRTEAPAAPAVQPMIFPVAGPVRWSDTFNTARDNGRRRHQGQDLMAARLTPLVAVWDGVVTLTTSASGHNMLRLMGDHGYLAWYMHINNDTPGTDDGLGSADYAFAPGLKSGDRVVAGQLIAWVGDSGNAESTAPHLHFEVHGPEGFFNPAAWLQAARQLEAPLVVAAPLPEKQEAGEVRWEGVVREYQEDSGLAVLDLLAAPDAQGRLVSVTAPRRQWVRLGKARCVGTERESLLGRRVTVLGTPGEAGRAANGRLVIAGEAGVRTVSGF